ncbi:GlxA family transcriptional regulator [Vibrio chaetopteri]|uniref:GlxA family transcriptional regulator n=1 Tax=Vibrio chaetopteri TaxID=3016528 RepID=A0AAU8BQB7_9VIBR
MWHIAILHYEGVMKSAAYGMEDLFRIANRLASKDLFEIHHEYSVHKEIPHTLPKVLVVPPSSAHPLPDFKCQVTLDYLKNMNQQSVEIAASCAGVFWLAEAGLLSGKTATTHWNLCERLKRNYPDIRQVERRDILVIDGSFTTAAGLFAYQDMVLQLIARFEGLELAKQVADFALLDMTGRLQSFYERFIPNTNHKDALVHRAQRYCEAHVNASVKSVAQHCGVSERSLHRKFISILGTSPKHYIVQLKIERARNLLCLSQMTVEKVAFELGYQDVSNFNRAFKKVTQLSPSVFRNRQNSQLT